jgi:hypothetical protein
MNSIKIDRIDKINSNEDGTVYVSAVIEDAVVTGVPTLYDPAEYGPALCESHFALDEGECLPKDDYELIEFIENLNLDWELVDNTEYLEIYD